MNRALPVLFVVLAVIAMTVGGCFLFHDDYPDDFCENDMDCFRAQGEACNLETNTCGPEADAAPTIDAPPPPDADLTPDAVPPPDAGPTPDADLTPDATPTPDAMP